MRLSKRPKGDTSKVTDSERCSVDLYLFPKWLKFRCAKCLCSGCYNKIPEGGCFRQQEFVSYCSESPRPTYQQIGSGDSLLPHTRYLVSSCGGRVRKVSEFSYKGTNPIHEGLITL
jgi:hypothetical protein